MHPQNAITHCLQPPSLHLTEATLLSEQEPRLLQLVAVPRRHGARCPRCKRLSRQIHSRYVRTLADLPCTGVRVVWKVHVLRFFCRNPRCPQRTFTQALPDFARKHARRTERMRKELEQIGLSQGGRPGAHFASKRGLPVSFKTLLRLVHASPCPEVKVPRALGVDDWAIRKGQRYGTILYDLEAHCPVDLLPDRCSESLAQWLKAHSGVEILSRDRASVYAEGAQAGAPQAVQVADRFHLVGNLGDALQRLLERKHTLVQQAAQQVAQAAQEVGHTPAGPGEEQAPAGALSLILEAPSPLCASDHEEAGKRPPTRAQQERESRRARRRARYEEVCLLYQQGMSLLAIAQLTHLDRRTVRRFVRADTFPERATTPARSSKLDPYKPFLHRRWQEGCHNALSLWREMCAQGYGGGQALVRRYLQSLRLRPSAQDAQATPSPEIQALERISARRAASLIVTPAKERTSLQQSFLDRLEELCPPFAVAHRMAGRFLAMVRREQEDPQEEPRVCFRAWLREALACGVQEMGNFARGLRQDQSAVEAGLSLPWSNGPVEGSITRLKLIKRQMYGRASFALLRRRVLEPP